MIKYLALGDSYTIGEGVHENERWPVVLAKKLQKKNISISDPIIVAKTGWTTLELYDALQNYNFVEKFDIVSLQIGVNNQYRGLSKDKYAEEFQQLISFSKAILTPQGFLFVVSIPDYGVTPFAKDKDPKKIEKEVEQFNIINFSISKICGLYFDITPCSKRAKVDKSLVASDNLHPSAKMYQEWVNLMVRDIYDVINLKKMNL